jgi:hypothetical protein
MSRLKEPPPRVRAEFVTLDGSEGRALEECQLATIKEILAWLHRRPGGDGRPREQRAA